MSRSVFIEIRIDRSMRNVIAAAVSLIAAVAMGGCSTNPLTLDGSGGSLQTNSVGTQAAKPRAVVGLQPFSNMPREKADLLARKIDRIARQRGISIVVGTANRPDFDLRGNVVADQLGPQVVVAYSWSVRDRSGKVLSDIGGEVPTTAVAGGGETITVQSGDTLSGLARRHRTTVSSLMAVNGLSGSMIRVGQSLKLPSAGGTGSAWESVTPAVLDEIAARVMNELGAVILASKTIAQRT